jgi:hypothetical protein
VLHTHIHTGELHLQSRDGVSLQTLYCIFYYTFYYTGEQHVQSRDRSDLPKSGSRFGSWCYQRYQVVPHATGSLLQALYYTIYCTIHATDFLLKALCYTIYCTLPGPDLAVPAIPGYAYRLQALTPLSSTVESCVHTNSNIIVCTSTYPIHTHTHTHTHTHRVSPLDPPPLHLS